ncbi:MAG TPA: hypothetical protein VLA83_02480, partial [Candidatus Binatia bacterium]|nr:hypothetical protein [Candidatus Binatia bacterium]
MSSKTDVDIAPPPTQAKKRKLRRFMIVACVALLVVVTGLLIYLSSGSFRETVRQRVIAELRQMTGGKVEVESFTWSLSTLHFEARNVTIHGREAAGEVPYAHADRIGVDVKIISFFARKISLENVAIDRFVLHLMIYPDGTTNQPPPQPGTPSDESSTQNLFDLAIKQIAVRQGTLMLDQEKIPFDLDGKDISAGMSYVPSQKAYDGHLDFTPLTIAYRDAPPMQAEMHVGFLLRSGETEIKSLRLAAGGSKVEGSGTLRSYNNPELTLQYQASLDLVQAGNMAKWKQLRAGRAELKGKGFYQNNRYSTQGSLSVRDLEWRDGTIRVSSVDASSPYSVTQDKIVLARLIAHAFGGTVQGDVQISNWISKSTAGKKTLSQQGTTRLHLSGVQASKVAAAISSAKMPLNKIELAGSISGDINSAWTGSLERAVSAMKLDVAPPASPSPKEVPVTAQLQATYHGDARTLDVAGLTLATRAIRVNATGSLGSEKAQAHVSLNATDLRELQPALDALEPGTSIPITLEGRSSFNGVIFGSLDAISTRGHLELEKFDTAFRLTSQPKGAQSKPARIHWDALSAELTYSPAMLSLQRGTLRRGTAQLEFSAGTTLRRGNFDENTSQLNFTLHIQNENVADMQALGGTSYAVAGVATADLQATGTLQNLQGRGKLQIAKLTIYGEPFKTFSSDLRLSGSESRLDNIQLAHNGARFTGFVAYDLGNKIYRFDLTGANIELANFQRFDLPRLSVQGQAGFHLTGSGTEDAPVVNGEIDLRNIVLNRETVGSLTILAETQGEHVQLRGRSNFENAELNVDGSVHLRNQWPGQITLKFSHLDFDPLIRAYFQGQITGHSSIAGEIDIHGPMKQPRNLVITGNVTQLSADVENVKLQNDGPIHFGLENESLKVDEFHLTGTETDLSGKGTVQLTGEHMLDLRSRGRFNLKLLQAFNQNLVAAGPATFTVNVTGKSARPQLSGRLELSGASASLLDLPNGLSQITGSLVFAQDRMQIEKLTAH